MLYRVEYTKTDGSVEVHAHLSDAEAALLGIQQDWRAISKATIEAEADEELEDAEGELPGEMKEWLGRCYELGLGDNEMRAIFESELGTLKRTEGWNGEAVPFEDEHKRLAEAQAVIEAYGKSFGESYG